MHDSTPNNQTTRPPWAKLLLFVLAGGSLLAILEFFKAPEKSIYWELALDAGHWPLFGFFALVCLGFVRVAIGQRVHRLIQYVLAFILAAAFCFITEGLQYFGPRDADLSDLIRGLSGALAFLFMALAFDSDTLRVASRTKALLKTVLFAGAVGLFWSSCGPFLDMARAYSQRADAFPQLCNFESSWEHAFLGTRDAEMTITAPPPGWSGESTDNQVAHVTFLPATFPALFLSELYPDWTGYERLCFAVFTELEAPVELVLTIKDQGHGDEYFDRFNRSLIIQPGINHICVDLDDVREAPRGRELDLSRLHNLVLFATEPEEEFSVFVDSFRLEGGRSPSSPSTEGLFDVGGHQLYLASRGTGEPAVIMDAGFGNSSEAWRPIRDVLAESTQVVLFDRAGYGESEPGPLPRDAEQVVHELARLLEAARIPSPYVLVGHSLGGMHMLHFAARFPDRTAALVLLDPAPMPALVAERFPGLFAMMESITQELEGIANDLERSSDSEDLARAPFQRTLASEHRMLISRDGEILAGDTIDPGIPVVVLASEVPNPAFGDSAASFQSFWIQESRALALSSFKGRFVLAVGSGHHIHQDVPDLVIDVIEELLDQLAAE